MEEFVTSIIKGIRERNRSGFWFTFILCYCIVNWRILVILFFEPEASFGKHSMIDAVFINLVPCGFWIALGYAILVSTIMPYVHAGIAWYNRRALRVKEQWILNAEKYKGSIHPDRLLAYKNELDKERLKNKEAKLEYDGLKSDYDDLIAERAKNFEDFKLAQLQPYIDSQAKLNGENESLREHLNKFTPFKQKLELTLRSITNFDIGTNLSDVQLRLYNSQTEAENAFSTGSSPISMVIERNNFITISGFRRKILAINTFPIENTDVSECIIFSEHPKNFNQYMVTKIQPVNGYFLVLVFNYFDNGIDKPEKFIGKQVIS